MRRIRLCATWLLALALSTALFASAAFAQDYTTDQVSFATSDGVTISASFYHPAGGAKLPAVILLHQNKSDRSSWAQLVPKLMANNYCALALDLRGHGASTNFSGRTRVVADFTDADYSAMINDVRAAAQWLSRRKDVNAGRLGIVGASIGANLAMQYAAEDRNVRTVIMMSPGLNYRSLEVLPYLDAYDKRALFMVVSQGDDYSYQSCLTIKKEATKASPLKLKVYDGTVHGTGLFDAHIGLDEIFVAWLLNHLVNS
jgi:dienelactone hydrolase